MKAILMILSVALALSGRLWTPAALAHDGDRALAHVCAAKVGGALRTVPADAECRSDERPMDLARQLIVTDSAGLVVGTLIHPTSSIGNRATVVVKVGKWWTYAEVNTYELVWNQRSIDRLHHEEPDCAGEPYMTNSHTTGTFWTPIVTIGPSWSAYARDRRTPGRTITVLSERLIDGSCVNTTAHPTGNVTRALFIEDLGYTPPFILRYVP